MKKQKIALYLVAVGCFVICMAVLNSKYDRFYRINGINNENRLLIMKYLTEEEQNYLVENSFPMDRFLRFLQYDEFHLRYLEYYEKIEQKKEWQGHPETVINYTNGILEKIIEQYPERVDAVFDRLLHSDLMDYYSQYEQFQFSLFDLYEQHYQNIGSLSEEDIDMVNNMHDLMLRAGYDYADEVRFLKEWDGQYTLANLSDFLNCKITEPDLNLVKNPQSLTTLIGENETLSSYVPEPLAIPYDVSRLRFGTYLRQDANAALEELTSAATQAVPSEMLLLVDAYRSYESQETAYQNESSTLPGGRSEYQLGLTVDFMVMGVHYHEFGGTAMSQFLQAHSWEYGFILRYPDSEAGNANTYRFVGKDAAKVMHEKGLTLEEYEGVGNE